jgi:hypothetical protein
VRHLALRLLVHHDVEGGAGLDQRHLYASARSPR